MESGRKYNASPRKISTLNALSEKYSDYLTFYSEIPTEKIDIEDFQEMAVERVKLLRILEIASLKTVKGMTVKEIVMDEMTKHNLKYFMPLIRGYPDAETKRRDYLSHFILRLCYCQSNELQRWFLAREMELFRLKFFNMDKKEDIVPFMKKSNLNFSLVTEEEKKLIASDLYYSTSKNINLDLTVIYKVHFTQVLDLIKSRKVLVKSGNAYVPQTYLISILASLFHSRLSQDLTICSVNIPKIQNDERLSKILKGLHTSYTGNDYCAKAKDLITTSDLDSLSIKSFPLCMRTMYETFKTTHHLKYFARLHLGLFLKGIGVSLEESLKFWREGFTKKSDVDADVFEKRYSYNIRHSYGTEGKRANYAPKSCMTIINTNVGPGENHGCPFKHYDASSLKQKLLSYNFSHLDVSIITDYSVRGHYQLACTKYFEVIHSVTNAKGINHPNLYFEESQKIMKERHNQQKPDTGKEVTKLSKKEVKNDEWGDESFNFST